LFREESESESEERREKTEKESDDLRRFLFARAAAPTAVAAEVLPQLKNPPPADLVEPKELP